VEWSTLLATLVGGAVGVSSSFLLDRARSSRDRREQWQQSRLEVYVDYLTELSRAYESLWALARREYETAVDNPDATARLILRASSMFQTRQRLLILASQSVRAAGQNAFDDIMRLRSVVGSGVLAQSEDFKAANGSYRASVEGLRDAIRHELDLPEEAHGTITNAHPVKA